ncbi:aerobic glycerol-3-phosphate dehydrogenase [Salmonella enterica subsp. enterica]|uniref:Aerobic glycerol-3-phosphate dehydrogenase n=1 Tax=Salmonella enterica I TaxID=59201 RepID=A0A3S4J9K7_SALET|nr:aerobic glycerol-3-phosphate dehydrogenase [Salmonella enterica subsp. enterica]
MRGFEYSDCWVDDARLVLANAQMVVRKGGEVLTRTRATAARRENGLWIVEAEDIDTGKKYVWQARGLVNATGPWVQTVLRRRDAPAVAVWHPPDQRQPYRRAARP